MNIEPDLKAIREAVGLSQEEVARRAEISLAYYQRIERKKSIPTVRIGQRIATVLRTSIEGLWPLNVR
jgi:transcriptional regulator with XRE-family HTH domain